MFRTYIKQKIKQVDRWLAMPPEEIDWLQLYESCHWLLAEVERRATLAGVPEAVKACQVEGDLATPEEVRQALAACLAAIPEPETDTLTPPEIAKQLSVAPDTVLAWIRSGELVASDIAARTSNRPRWIVRKIDLDRFLKGRQPEPDKQPPQLQSSFKRYST